MESATLPGASLVTFPRGVGSPRASWLLAAWETRATARFKFAAMSPNSLVELTSARALESPAARRPENCASSCTGETKELFRRQPRNTIAPSTRNRANRTDPLAPLGSEPKSNMDAPFDCRPALYASHSTPNRTSPLTRTTVQIVELNRDFMLASKSLWRLPHRGLMRPPQSNAWARKYLEQSPQIQQQSQPVLVPQHADAMRHILRRLLQQTFGRDAIGADDLIGGDPDAHVAVMTLAAQGTHHNALS